jgi:hypothetical protein
VLYRLLTQAFVKPATGISAEAAQTQVKDEVKQLEEEAKQMDDAVDSAKLLNTAEVNETTAIGQ